MLLPHKKVRAVIQRVDRASVSVEGKEIASIGKGLLVLLGVSKDDGEEDARYIAYKIKSLRIFEDENGRMNLSVGDVGGEVLLVSQFTLLASTKKGKRPDFTNAAPPERAEELFSLCFSLLREEVPTKTGVFGAKMIVNIVNNGPVTIILDSKQVLS